MFHRPPLHSPDRPLHHFLQDAADRHPEKVALRFDDDSYMYREIDSTGNSFAHALAGLGDAGSTDDLSAFVAERLAGYQHVDHFVFVDAIPRTASGKVLRRGLKAADETIGAVT